MTTKNGLPTMTTFTGKTFDFINPEPDSICIEDIAHALALECRFANQSRVHYSVAQHSVLVSQVVDVRDPVFTEIALRRMALLHDAAEAYLGDLSWPLKTLLPDYKRIEDRVHRAIAKRFGLASLVLPSQVKDADRQLLANEGMSFMSPDWRDAAVDPCPKIGVIQALDAPRAEALFLKRFEELFGRP